MADFWGASLTNCLWAKLTGRPDEVEQRCHKSSTPANDEPWPLGWPPQPWLPPATTWRMSHVVSPLRWWGRPRSRGVYCYLGCESKKADKSYLKAEWRHLRHHVKRGIVLEWSNSLWMRGPAVTITFRAELLFLFSYLNCLFHRSSLVFIALSFGVFSTLNFKFLPLLFSFSFLLFLLHSFLCLFLITVSSCPLFFLTVSSSVLLHCLTLYSTALLYWSFHCATVSSSVPPLIFPLFILFFWQVFFLCYSSLSSCFYHYSSSPLLDCSSLLLISKPKPLSVRLLFNTFCI